MARALPGGVLIMGALPLLGACADAPSADRRRPDRGLVVDAPHESAFALAPDSLEDARQVDFRVAVRSREPRAKDVLGATRVEVRGLDAPPCRFIKTANPSLNRRALPADARAVPASLALTFHGVAKDQDSTCRLSLHASVVSKDVSLPPYDATTEITVKARQSEGPVPAEPYVKVSEESLVECRPDGTLWRDCRVRPDRRVLAPASAGALTLYRVSYRFSGQSPESPSPLVLSAGPIAAGTPQAIPLAYGHAGVVYVLGSGDLVLDDPQGTFAQEAFNPGLDLVATVESADPVNKP